MSVIRTLLLAATILLAVSIGLPWSIDESGGYFGISVYTPNAPVDPRPIRLLVIYTIAILSATEAWRLNRVKFDSFARVVISVVTVWFATLLAFGAWMTWVNQYDRSSVREIGANCVIAAVALLGAASGCCVSHVISAYRLKEASDSTEEVRFYHQPCVFMV